MSNRSKSVAGESVPQYMAIKATLLERYIDGRPADHLLPPERTLAAEFGVTRTTLRRAIDELVADGVLYRVQGGGTYCVGPGIAKSLRLTSFSEDISALGKKPGSILLDSQVGPAGQQIGRHLNLTPGTPVVRVRRVRLADGEPMCLETTVFAEESVPRLDRHDLTGSLYALIAEEYGLRPAWAEQEVEAIVLDPDEAAQLGVAPFSPALQAKRVSFDARGRRIEFCVSTYRADRYSLRFTVRRES